MLDPETLELDQVCRTCMLMGANLVSLQSTIDPNTKPQKLDVLLQVCTSVEVTEDDKLPQNVCLACIKTLVECSRFMESCVATDKQFENQKPSEFEISMELESSCRTCATVRADLQYYSLFPPNSTDESADLLEKLTSFSTLQIADDDGLPSRICENCFKVTNKTYNFIKTSQKSDNTLRLFLGKTLIEYETENSEFENSESGDTHLHLKPEDLIPPPQVKKKQFVHVNGVNQLGPNPVIPANPPILQLNPQSNGIIFRPKNTISQTVAFVDGVPRIVRVDTNVLLNSHYGAGLNQNEPPRFKLVQVKGGAPGQAQFTLRPVVSRPSVQPRILNSNSNPSVPSADCDRTSGAPVTSNNNVEQRSSEHSAMDVGENLESDEVNGTGDDEVTDPLTEQMGSESPTILNGSHSIFSNIRISEPRHVHHNKSGQIVEKPYKCHICGKATTLPHNLREHMKMHDRVPNMTTQRKFPCTYCNRSFGSNFKLNEHVRVHTGERPFKCNICPLSFIRKTTLNAHMHVHSTGKPNQECPYCSKTFHSIKMLKNHLKTHSAPRLYRDALDDPVKSSLSNAEYLQNTPEELSVND